MQQAIYNNINVQRPGQPVTPEVHPASLLRWVACRWDLVGVLALMGSSAAYGAFTLSHLGF